MTLPVSKYRPASPQELEYWGKIAELEKQQRREGKTFRSPKRTDEPVDEVAQLRDQVERLKQRVKRLEAGRGDALPG